ncbi:MAG: NAD-dependent epimerase/dehydratase family protein [Solirubrobacterales bacterium]
MIEHRTRTLVTGGAGFIGSNLVDALLLRGDEVTVVDDLSTGRRINLDGALASGAELLELDIRDGRTLRQVVADREPQTIFHLAAQIDVRKSLADPAFDAAVNVGGTANVLEAAREAGTGRVVFISTGGAMYGEGAGKPLPLDESAQIEPLSAYGQSKFASEGYLWLYHRLYGVSAMALRLGNVYGPRQDPLGEAGVVAIFCGKLREGARPTVFGDGAQTRDYVFVGDIVDAALAAAASDHVGALNIGRGEEVSVLDLIGVLRELSGDAGFDPEFAPPRPGEVQRISLDAGLAEKVLGWTAKTDLREGMRLTLDSMTLEAV